MPLLLKVSHPSSEYDFFPERTHLLNVKVNLLPVPGGPFIENSIESL